MSQIFNYIFLSPLIFILLFFISSVFMRRARVLFVFFSLLLYFFSTGFMAKALLGSLENEYRKAQKISFRPDAVVVLGGGANAFVSDSKLSASGYKRFVEALSLAKKMNVPLLFTGGGLVEQNGITEAEAAAETAARLADSFGFAIPAGTALNGGFELLFEGKSQNTVQNAKNSILIMRQNALTKPKVILVTSAFHMKRAKIVFEKYDFKVTPMVVDFRTKATPISYIDAAPEFKNLENNFLALREYIGILAFFLLG